jgi:hypothetical protein
MRDARANNMIEFGILSRDIASTVGQAAELVFLIGLTEPLYSFLAKRCVPSAEPAIASREKERQSKIK